MILAALIYVAKGLEFVLLLTLKINESLSNLYYLGDK